MNLSSTPSAPTRAKRAQGIKTVNRSVPSATSTTTPVSSLSTEAAQKPSNNTDLPAAAAEIISPPRRPLSAINITGEISSCLSLYRFGSHVIATAYIKIQPLIVKTIFKPHVVSGYIQGQVMIRL